LTRPNRQTTLVAPTSFRKRGGVTSANFGRAAYGNLQIQSLKNALALTLTFRLGEKLGTNV
jgi:hypothetical protein